MITKAQYLILKKFKKEEIVRQDKFLPAEICSKPFDELLTAKFINGLEPVDICGHILPTKYQITTDGIKAYEEYERSHKSGKRANIALILSAIAIVVSIFAIIFR